METKEKLADLLKQIEQKKKELKQLKKEYETAFDAVAASWREETKALFPQLETCNIGEYVGVDITINGQVYNICLLEDSQKISCMFSLDCKDKDSFSKSIDLSKPEFEELKNVCNYHLEMNKKQADINAHRFKTPFCKENYDEAFKFFIEVVKAAISCYKT